MELGIFFYVICALWAMTVIMNFIQATRICYAIEARSGRRPLRSGLPGFANVIPVAFNVGVAKDEETQALRWEMNKRLLIILGGFVIFFFFLSVAVPQG